MGVEEVEIWGLIVVEELEIWGLIEPMMGQDL